MPGAGSQPHWHLPQYVPTNIFIFISAPLSEFLESNFSFCSSQTYEEGKISIPTPAVRNTLSPAHGPVDNEDAKDAHFMGKKLLSKERFRGSRMAPASLPRAPGLSRHMSLGPCWELSLCCPAPRDTAPAHPGPRSPSQPPALPSLLLVSLEGGRGALNRPSEIRHHVCLCATGCCNGGRGERKANLPRV